MTTRSLAEDDIDLPGSPTVEHYFFDGSQNSRIMQGSASAISMAQEVENNNRRPGHVRPSGDDRDMIIIWQNARKQAMGLRCLATLGVAIVALFAFSTVASIFAKDSTQNAYWTRDELLEMQQINNEVNPPPADLSSVSARKVIYITIDGVPWYIAQENNSLHQLFYSSEFSSDMRVTSGQSIIPSFSDGSWVAMATGMTPEFTGMVGNGHREIIEESVIRKAQQWGLKNTVIGTKSFVFHLTTLTGDRTWAVSLYLDPFVGYGYLDVLEDPAEGETTYQLDLATQKTLLQLLSDNATVFDLILTAFTDTDNRAHEYGIRSAKYESALENITAMLRSVMTAVSNNTVVVIAADHGHIPPGGHGGTEQAVVTVPMAIFLKNSNISSADYTYPQLSSHGARVVDLASTICVLLGLPPPAHSQGVFMQDALGILSEQELRAGLQSLWKQKQSKKVRKDTSDASLSQVDTPASQSYTDADAIAFYSAQIMELDSVFEDTRSVDKTKQLALNSTLTVGISMFLLSLFFCSLCVWTPADVPSLLFRHRLNRIAFLFALILWFSFMLFSVPAALILYRYILRPWNDWQWTLSIVNNVSSGMVLFGLTFLISTFFSLVLYAIFSYLSHRSPGEFYLFRCYAALLSVLIVALLESVASVGHLWFTFISRVSYVDATLLDTSVTFLRDVLLNLQFQVDCVSVSIAPLACLSVFGLVFCGDNYASTCSLTNMTLFKTKFSWCQSIRAPKIFYGKPWQFCVLVMSYLVGWIVEKPDKASLRATEDSPILSAGKLP